MEMESAFDMLAEDPSGQGLKRLREELFEMRMDVKRAMDAGMTSDEMAVAGRSWPQWIPRRKWRSVSTIR